MGQTGKPALVIYPYGANMPPGRPIGRHAFFALCLRHCHQCTSPLLENESWIWPLKGVPDRGSGGCRWFLVALVALLCVRSRACMCVCACVHACICACMRASSGCLLLFERSYLLYAQHFVAYTGLTEFYYTPACLCHRVCHAGGLLLAQAMPMNRCSS